MAVRNDVRREATAITIRFPYPRIEFDPPASFPAQRGISLAAAPTLPAAFFWRSTSRTQWHAPNTLQTLEFLDVEFDGTGCAMPLSMTIYHLIGTLEE